MNSELLVYNTLSKKKETFVPIKPPYVGMYVCGPTVYGPPHLGHARSAITFDIIYRYLNYLGFKVRYVRNVTDVGHLENDADEGEDKIAKKARLEQLEPMEIAQQYMNLYHSDMDILNVQRPSIEPLASGHIPEQIRMISKIISNGFAYESHGSVYFDIQKYAEKNPYGEVSGRIVEDLLQNTRELDGQSEKRNQADFALWKKASEEHIMRWDSPWSVGFPGWHIECSAMSAKYLGEYFDIHGGGMDLMFPHHESEVAQSKACNHHTPSKYWLHNNMITINGQKMGKSLGNFITLQELFTGNHKLLEQAYSPMAIRFFVLQAHYRSTLDFSNEALKASGKGFNKLLNSFRILKNLKQDSEIIINEAINKEIKTAIEKISEGMNDDFNTGIAISHLFTLSKFINAFYNKQQDIHCITKELFEKLFYTYNSFFTEVLGLADEKDGSFTQLASQFLSIYKKAKEDKQYDKVDEIRNIFKSNGLLIKDMKHGVDWAYEE
ncbi:MAG: cysteine--tRNA ligase [Bacteroidota bacterium]|nr:cysteine--tRNA ligase [Bacteroidota bacterium]